MLSSSVVVLMNSLTDQGFERDVGEIIKIVNAAQTAGLQRTNVLLSATLTESVNRLAEV